jgi:antitoxin CptB
MDEVRETKVKRLRMRSWRRGIKEMDLILGGFSDTGLVDLSDAELEVYDVMLEENDHDLFSWVCGHVETPKKFSKLLQKVMAQSGAL